MRIDKFLKVSRIVKRRSVAKEMADQGRVLVNGKPTKSATKVSVGDIVEIQFGNRELKIKVMELLDTTKKENADKMYQVL